MTHYSVQWEIDIEADTPEEAAREARKIQLDPENIADHFSVYWQDAAGHPKSREVNTEELT